MGTKIHRVETYLCPRDAAQISGFASTTLKRYTQQGLLTAYRTTGGHRRYALSELRAIHRTLAHRRQRFTPKGAG